MVKPDESTLSISAHSIVKAAQDEGRAAFVVLGGGSEFDYRPTVQASGAFRAGLETMWKQALNGGEVSENVKADSYGISAPGFVATNYRAQVISDIPVCVRLKDGTVSDWNPVPGFLNTFSTLLWHIEATLIIYGVCYLRKVYNPYNYPAGLEWIHPEDVDPETDIDGNVINYYIDAVKFSPRQIVEIRTFDPNRSLNGKSEFEVALSRLTTEQAIVRHAGAFFFNAARPDGMLVSKIRLNKAEIKKAEADWKQFKGSKNAWKTFVSSGQWEWIPLQSAPADLAMVDLNTANDRAILAIMRVNPALVGFADVSDPLSAGATMKEIKRNHIEDVALPRFAWICRHLCEQWLYADFGLGDMYTLSADRAKMPILSDVTTDAVTNNSTLAGAGSVMGDYDELRAFMGLPPRGETYLKRNPIELNTVLLNSGLTMDEYRDMLGLTKWGLFGGDLVRLPTGQLVRRLDLPQIAAANLKAIIQAAQPPANPFGGFGSGAANQPPAPAAPPQLSSGPAPQPAAPPIPDKTLGKLARLIIQSKRSGNATDSCAVLLSLADNPQLTAVQTIVKAGSNGSNSAPVEWVEPRDFHVTLLYADKLSVVAETHLYDTLANMPVMELQTAKLGTFPAGEDGLSPLVLFVAKSGDGYQTLADYQGALYSKALEVEPGALLSDFSNPEKYTPHITLGYVPEGFEFPDFTAPLTVSPSSIQFSREVYEITYEKKPGVPATVDPETETGAETETEGEPAAQPQRAKIRGELAVVWPQNNFILMAQRMASNVVQAVGVNGVVWYPPGNWALKLGGFDGTPGDANKVLNGFDPASYDLPSLDLTADAFGIVGSEICLLCSPAEGLNKLGASVRLALEESGLTPSGPPGAGIALGHVETSDPNALMDLYNALKSASPELGLPLVASNLDLLVNGESRNSWALRTDNALARDELHKWKRKATGRRGADSSFQTSALKGSLVESFVRSALAEIEPDDLEAVKDIFARAQKVMTDGVHYLDIPEAPDEYTTYWDNFDTLEHDLGKAWAAYMEKALPDIVGMLATDTNPTSIMAPLAKLHDSLTEDWIGTPENPGDLVKLVLAGMAAGNESLKQTVNMNPNGRAASNPVGLGFNINWDLMSQEAYDFARQYSYKLIKGIDQTTQTKVQAAFGEWIKSGQPTSALRDLLTPIFQDAERAATIAQTESIRVYNEGAFQRWQDVGVTKAVWRTVADPKVCPICRPLNGQVADISAGWVHPGGNYIDPYDNQRVNGDAFRGRVYRESAHVRCRCFRRPVVVYEKGQVGGKPEPQPGETVSKTLASDSQIKDILARAEKDFEPLRKKTLAQVDKIKAVMNQRANLALTRRALTAEMEPLWDKLYDMETSTGKETAEYKTLREQLRELEKKHWALDDQIVALDEKRDKLRANQNKVIHKALFTDHDMPTDVRYPNKYTPPTKDQLKESEKAQTFLSRLFDGQQFGSALKVDFKNMGKGRANAAADGSEIRIAEDDKADVIVHELGHIIEDLNPDIHKRAVEFLIYRSKGEKPQQMKYYSAGEIAVKDNFQAAYSGKYYFRDVSNPEYSPDGIYATELISMGLQYMYTDPAQFAIDDPEFFNFILAITRRLT